MAPVLKCNYVESHLYNHEDTGIEKPGMIIQMTFHIITFQNWCHYTIEVVKLPLKTNCPLI
jgi:hypothetical protein